jgi:hypothetical protein
MTLHLSAVGAAQADDPKCLAAFRIDQDVESSLDLAQGHVSGFAGTVGARIRAVVQSNSADNAKEMPLSLILRSFLAGSNLNLSV